MIIVGEQKERKIARKLKFANINVLFETFVPQYKKLLDEKDCEQLIPKDSYYIDPDLVSRYIRYSLNKDEQQIQYMRGTNPTSFKFMENHEKISKFIKEIDEKQFDTFNVHARGFYFYKKIDIPDMMVTAIVDSDIYDVEDYVLILDIEETIVQASS